MQQPLTLHQLARPAPSCRRHLGALSDRLNRARLPAHVPQQPPLQASRQPFTKAVLAAGSPVPLPSPSPSPGLALHPNSGSTPEQLEATRQLLGPWLTVMSGQKKAKPAARRCSPHLPITAVW